MNSKEIVDAWFAEIDKHPEIDFDDLAALESLIEKEVAARVGWWVAFDDRLPDYSEIVELAYDRGDSQVSHIVEWSNEEHRYLRMNGGYAWRPRGPLPPPPEVKDGKDKSKLDDDGAE